MLFRSSRRPDPGDDWVQAEYEFVLRSADGAEEVVRETHRLGSFRRDTWLRLLAEAGFEPRPGPAPGDPAQRDAVGRAPGNLFVARRPDRAVDDCKTPRNTPWRGPVT